MKWLKSHLSIEAYIAAFLLCVLAILLGLQVFFRFGLNKSITWSEEMARYVFVWTIYFGCILAAKEDKHIRVTAHFTLFPPKVQTWTITIADLLWIGFNLIMAYVAAKFVLSMLEFPFYSQTMGFNLFYIYAIVPLAYFLMAVRILQLMINRLKQHKQVHIKDSRLDL